MKIRKRPAIWMIISFVGSALVITVVKAFETNLVQENLAAVVGMIATIAMGLIGISTKIIESEEKGKGD